MSTTPSSGNIKKFLVRKPAQGVRKEEEEEEECETKKEDTDKKKIVGVRENNVDKEEKENYQDEEKEENNKEVKKTFRDLETGTFREKMIRFKVMAEGRDCMIRSGFCHYEKSLGQQGANTELMTDTPESGGTNQKRTKLFNIEKNQLPPTLGLNNASIEDI